ncbi:MAG: glycosyltransferase [Bacteroidales bacterium]|nr:glycosyltransferase [Bacteroidales bacterium]
MNILHLLSWFPTPDDPTLGNFCLRQINALPDDCHSVILSVCDGKDLKQSFEIHEIKGERYTHIQIAIRPPKNNILRKIKMLRMYQHGLHYIKKKYFTPDFIHLHVTFPLGQVALLWHRLFGYPYVLTEHWTIYQPQNQHILRGRLKRKIVNIANHASVILPVSLDLQRNMERNGIHNQFQVVYNLVDTKTFTIGTPTQNGKKRMLHISTLRDEAKNFSGILRVVEKLRKQREDFELHVIHDYEAPEFNAFVKEHGLNDCVIFHGKKNSTEVAEAFSKTDFFVLFSNFENLPCVIVEAFASGVPVLSTNVGGIAEIVNSDRGILVNSGDEDALLQGMNQMLDTYGKYNREAIRQYAQQTFANEIIGKQIYEQYQKVLQNHRKPKC